MKYGLISTHPNTHLDEITGIWLLRKFGEEKFPGISTAKIVYDHSELQESDGALLLGIGGGRFDEHPTVDEGRKYNECCATLVAKELGLIDEPILKPILKFVLNTDLASGQQFDLASIVKFLHQQYPDDPEKVIDWAITALEAKYRAGLEFWTSARDEFEKNAVVEEFISKKDERLKLVSIVSDNERVAAYARSKIGGNAAVVIQRNSSGNVQIFTNKRFGVDLYDVVRAIRLTEQKQRGRVIVSDWKRLSVEGKLEGCDNWFFHEAGQMLLNGSLTAKDVPPTWIPFHHIVVLVHIGVSKIFLAARASRCEQGLCTSTRNDHCPWYDFGLQRCRIIRGIMKANNHNRK